MFFDPNRSNSIRADIRDAVIDLLGSKFGEIKENEHKRKATEKSCCGLIDSRALPISGLPGPAYDMVDKHLRNGGHTVLLYSYYRPFWFYTCYNLDDYEVYCEMSKEILFGFEKHNITINKLSEPIQILNFGG